MPARYGAAQSRPLVAPAASAIYQRLLPQISRIKLFDHHAHPAVAGDADVDIAPPPPGSTPLRMREDNPEPIAAARALFAFPYADLAGAHARWLVDRKAALKRARPGPQYFNDILDKIGIETSMANRVAMADYLDPARFKWVFFVDCFMFPFDNSALASRNPDEAVYMPLQTKLRLHYAQQLGIQLIFTTAGAALATVVMTFPLMVRAIRISLEGIDMGFEEAARTPDWLPLFSPRLTLSTTPSGRPWVSYS